MKLNLNLIFLSGMIAVTAVACKSSSSSTASTPTTPAGVTTSGGSPALTNSSLSSGGYNGTGLFTESCININGSNAYGTNLTAYSILRYVSYSSGGYNLTVGFINGSSCSGNEAFAYTQSGTYTVGAATTSPSGGYEILYSASSAELTVYGQYFSGAWATTFNGSSCAGGFGGSFSTSVAASLSAVNLTCNTNGITLSFPPLGNFYDVIVPNSITSTTQFNASSGNGNPFYMGQFSSYPTTASVSFH